MNRQTLNQICEQVYHRFPEVAGSQPKMENRPGDQVLLVFRGKGKTSDNRVISHTVRVVAGPDGKIIKMTASK